MSDTEDARQGLAASHPEEANATSNQPKTTEEQKYRSVRHLENIEDLEGYAPGGFHPVDLHDILDDRFEVLYKLGSGGIATIWLCYEFRVKQWRAVKINAASRSSPDCPELNILQLLKGKSVGFDALDAHNVGMPLETFWVEGPNGRHLCSVLPVLGPTVWEWRQFALGTDGDRINDICYQITQGLGFLHSNGICHGDFRPQNILMKLKEDFFDGLGKDEVLDRFPAPERVEILTIDGERSPNAPKWVVEGIRWLGRFKHLISDNIAIVDFGESYQVSSPPSSLGIPKKYAAPEVIFGGTPGIESDIWSLAFTLIEVRQGQGLENDLEGVIWLMERFLGPVPFPYRPVAADLLYKEAMYRFEKFGSKYMSQPDPPSNEQLDDGSSLSRLTATCTDLIEAEEDDAENSIYTDQLEIFLGTELDARVFVPDENDPTGTMGTRKYTLYHLPENEVPQFADILKKMLRYNPGERISASEALKHHWFNKRAVDSQQEDSKSPITSPITSFRVDLTVAAVVTIAVFIGLYIASVSFRGIFKPLSMSDVPSQQTGVYSIMVIYAQQTS